MSFSMGNTGGRKEVERERRKSLALDRRTNSALSQVVKGEAKAFGSTTLTPRTLVKRSNHKEHVLNILSEKNLTIGAFGRVETQEDQGSWKIRPNAQQSQHVLHLKKRMQQRKRQMTVYTKNNTFTDIFKESEEQRRPITEGFIVAGTIELVARDVIDRNAERQHREKKGVWAQLGKPYACFGVPACVIPKACPMPIEPLPFDEVYSFFGSPEKVQTMDLDQVSTNFRRRRDQKLITQESLNMQGMLIKLGLQGSCRFPREPLIAANDLRTAVKVGASYTVGKSLHHGIASPFDTKSRVSLDLSELSESWRCASGGSQSLLDMDFSSVTSPTPTHLSVRNSIRSLPQLSSPSPGPQIEGPGSSSGDLTADSLVYDWKKKFANMRIRLQERINKRIMSRVVRRQYCRSCSPFTAEISNLLIQNLDEHGGGSKTPIVTGHIWKSVEEKQAKERAASMIIDPELEAISRFYERVCGFVNNQKMDDPLMDMLVHHLKGLLEEGYKLEKKLLIALCQRLSSLQDHVEATGRMACLMPILNFICKELHLTSAEFNSILGRFGLDWYNSFSRPSFFASNSPH